MKKRAKQMFNSLWKHAKRLLYFCIVNISVLSAQDCDQPALQTSYHELTKKVDAYELFPALKLADSLIQLMQVAKTIDCPLFLWIQYEKGEALELFMNRSDEALSLYYDIIRKAKAKENWELVAQAYISIARTHEIIGRDKDCLRSLEIAREVIEEHQLYAIYSRFAVRYSSYHRIFDNRDTARVYAAEAIDLGKKYKVERSELDGNLLMGILSKEFENSIYCFEEATRIYLKRRAYFGAASQQLNIARKYYESGDLQQTSVYLDSAYRYVKQTSQNDNDYYYIFERYYDYKRKVFESQSMIDSAYYYLKKSQEAGQLKNIRINQQDINQKETAFAIEREQEKLRFEQQRTRFLITSLFFVSLILIAFFVAFLNNKRKKHFISKQKDLITLKNQELNKSLHRQSILLSEIHHRVKNNLQLVMSLLSIRGYKVGDKKMQIHFEDISNKIYSISLIHEQLYQLGEFERIDVNQYFTQLANHFQVLDNAQHVFEWNSKIKPIFLNLETILPLGIICSELMSNSLKYGNLPNQQLSIQLSIKKKDNKYHLYYQDNGSGYIDGKLEDKPNSMGSILINSMVRQLMAESKIYNKKGAVFTLVFQEKIVSIVK